MSVTRRDIVLEGRNLSMSYGTDRIIEDISLCVEKGELVSLLGISGVGKTTLFNILSGLEAPCEGDVYLNGECITGKCGKIGYMQQSDLLLPFKSVIGNAMIPLVLKGVGKETAKKEAAAVLEEFGLLECVRMYPKQLSGGMRQRVALARTFLTKCSVMLFDEPFSALDAITRSDMQKWFKRVVKEHGISGVFITHDIDEAIILSDRIYILKGDVGRIGGEIRVDFDTEDTLSEKFIKLKREILEKVR